MKTTRGKEQSPKPRKGPSQKEYLYAGIGALEAGKARFEHLKERGRHVVRKGQWGKASERAPVRKQETTRGELPDPWELVRMLSAIRGYRNITAAPAATKATQTEMSELIEEWTPSAVPTAAMVLQARRNSAVRLAVAEEFGLLTAEEVAEVRGSTAVKRSALASRWKQAGRLLAVTYQGRDRYPGFQFDEEGRPLPVVAEVVALLGQGWETAIWFVAANPYLDDDRPVDRLRSDAAAVVAAAEREAETPEF